ncbi:hypothetical protein [Bradyrhizobium sp. 2S1]|uniref:hypothetical protein n=1 Tax=Bradyrhizobium sp. 2S1 TaxID=1404429 RepID=UPI0014091FB9|nr:hypothetical protein [Bradyrhizobium sp. 2S1]MCK7667844.1 hypothetical protein [Bradyrhizobium sp. 2S1]
MNSHASAMSRSPTQLAYVTGRHLHKDTIKPKRTQRPIATAAALPTGACEGDHWIEEVLAGGKIIELEDRSLWKVDPADQVTASLWLSADDVLVCDGKIVNVDDKESVQASKIR